MKKISAKLIISVILIALSLALLVGCVAGYVVRGKDSTKAALTSMRTEAVVKTATTGLADSIAADARLAKNKELRAAPDFRQMGTDKLQALCQEAEDAARAEAMAMYSDTSSVDFAAVEKSLPPIIEALAVASEQETAEKEAYRQVYTDLMASVSDWVEFTGDLDEEALWAKMVETVPALAEHENWKKGMLKLAAAKKASAEAAAADENAETTVSEEEVAVDSQYFTASDTLTALQNQANDSYQGLLDVLVAGIPALGDLSSKNADTVRGKVMDVIDASNGDFTTQYNAYANAGASGQSFVMRLAANADNLLLLFIAVALVTLLYVFWKPITKKMGVSRSIILLFFICLILAAQFYKINVSLMLGNILERVSMYGVLVLAMLPGIQCGIGLNMGMTIGAVSGLFAVVTALNYNLTGWPALIFSIVLGAVLAVPLGWAYSLLLNRMKGSEMTISTYVGYSFVSLMCMVWMAVPYKNPKIIWMLAGHGLRVTHSLLGVFAHKLDDLASFNVLGVSVPTGGILFFLLCCLLMYLFTRSKKGISLSAVGSNPRFAEASGINVDNMRTLGTVLSTVLAAIGIVVYSQAFGYAQLYNAPKQLGFIAASAILIGGASVKKAKVSHVIIGVLLFEGVLSMGQQVANEAVSGGGLSEVMRILISNGIILYALTQSGGEQNA